MKAQCAVDGCLRDATSRGWCGTHYARWRKTGDPGGAIPAPRARRDATERFWEKVDKSGDCWLWTGGTTERGYGQFSEFLGENERRKWGAHRYAYVHCVGPIPDGLVLDHLCRNPRCVNPDHLEPVTNKENILRGVSPSAKAAAATHCIRGHEWTPENTHQTPTQRVCRACIRIRVKRRKRMGNGVRRIPKEDYLR